MILLTLFTYIFNSILCVHPRCCFPFPRFLFFRDCLSFRQCVFVPTTRERGRGIGNLYEEQNRDMERKDLARGLCAMRAGDNGGTYTANLPAAVSNNWLPRQVHIPPIMCISAPCTAMLGPGRTGYRGRYARTFLPSRMYPSQSCLPRKSFNESVIDALSRQALISLSCGLANRYLRNRLGHSDLTESLTRVTIGQP